MTRAPENLLAARRLLLAELGPHGLASGEVGIVGDTAHQRQGNSYHLGLPEQASTGYAATESPRDKAGLCEYASALDLGEFEVTVGARSYNLRHFSAWIVGQCKANASDTRDIREVIWSPDGSTVRRWDRLGRRTTGDSSHRWHTHISFFRDSTKAGRDLTPLFRRYLTTIGLLTPPEDDVTPADIKKAVLEALREPQPFQSRGIGNANPGVTLSARTLLEYGWSDAKAAHMLAASAAGQDGSDVTAIVQGVLAGLTPQAIAAAIPAELAKDVADELHARMAG